MLYSKPCSFRRCLCRSRNSLTANRITAARFSRSSEPSPRSRAIFSRSFRSSSLQRTDVSFRFFSLAGCLLGCFAIEQHEIRFAKNRKPEVLKLTRFDNHFASCLVKSCHCSSVAPVMSVNGGRK